MEGSKIEKKNILPSNIVSPSLNTLKYSFLFNSPLVHRQPATDIFFLPSVTVNTCKTLAAPETTTQFIFTQLSIVYRENISFSLSVFVWVSSFFLSNDRSPLLVD